MLETLNEDTLDGATVDPETIGGETFAPSTVGGGSVSDVTTSEAPRADSDLPQRYRDLGLIGSGGMGEVRRMVDRRLGCTVAVKILDGRLRGSTSARARFLAEARLTARLRHPGIVAAFDQGVMPDGRPWFAMTEVRGRELAAVMPEVGLRRRVELLARVCEAMAYAHSQEVIHRDLKPANIMVGDFGEVLVMDWGLGRALTDVIEEDAEAVLTDEEQTLNTHATRYGQVMGTPTYMPPEQAVGLIGLLRPASDVYALGAILYEMLAGEPPYPRSAQAALDAVLAGPPPPLEGPSHRDLPLELVAICERAMAREIADRYPDAGAMMRPLKDWLDGAQRREKALTLIEQARQQRPDILRRRTEALRLRVSARELLGGMESWEPPADKRRAWDLEEAAESLETEAAVLEAGWLQTLRASLNLVPELPEAHAALAAHYRERLLAADQARRHSEVAQSTALLSAHDRGQHARFLKGEGAVTLHTTPSGATVECLRYVRDGRRLVAVSQGILGTTPLDAVTLSQGSYLLRITAPGHAPVRYPVLIEREGHWAGIAPGAGVPTPIALPPVGSLSEDECCVPAGWFWSGGDPDATESLPSRRLWVEAMVVQRHPVTHARYLAFINDLVEQGRAAEAEGFVPRARAQAGGSLMYACRQDGRYTLRADDQGRCGPELPVVAVSWHAACAFAAWEGARTGKPWRLPNELEWEKAARGVDRRFCVWGDDPEPGWSRILGSLAGPPSPAPVTDYPEDESVYGVRGMSGNVRDWCLNIWKMKGPETEGDRLLLDAAGPENPDLRALRGGAWSVVPYQSRLAGRFVNHPDRWFVTLGFRLFYSQTSKV
ncbi:MAG: serine/threonine protein kinase/formylglycine-generating enzyme required for sulfatase activity [Myxococcota bacterium]|jgi:serine/threonine protein kinase/formylglycine-generating enzyme required for sulfatase activity